MARLGRVDDDPRCTGCGAKMDRRSLKPDYVKHWGTDHLFVCPTSCGAHLTIYNPAKKEYSGLTTVYGGTPW